MAKTLTEVAQQILTEGGIPSVSPMDAGHPDRDTRNMNPNMGTLRPKSRDGDDAPIVNPNSHPPMGGADDLGGATPVSTYKDNLGAKASGKKDSSKSSQAAVQGEPMKKMMEEDVEISEELEDFINEMIEQGASEDEIAEAIAENFEIISEDSEEEEEESGKEHKGKKKHKEEEEEEDEESSAKKRKEMMKEHVDALLAGENLSEDFRSKAETIFESAVSTRVNEELETLEQAYATSLEEEVAKIRAELTEQVDDYLNYVVEKWVEDNEVAIEAGLRTELTEDFISGLKNLFTEHYMDIPDEKVSVVEELGKKVEQLEAKLNEEIDRNVGLSKQINEAKQFEVLITACEGLTTTQAEKLKALSDNVSFTNPEEYAAKIFTLKESYFPSTGVTNDYVLDTNDVDSNKGMITEETTGRMSAYVKALGKKLPN